MKLWYCPRCWYAYIKAHDRDKPFQCGMQSERNTDERCNTWLCSADDSILDAMQAAITIGGDRAGVALLQEWHRNRPFIGFRPKT